MEEINQFSNKLNIIGAYLTNATTKEVLDNVDSLLVIPLINDIDNYIKKLNYNTDPI